MKVQHHRVRELMLDDLWSLWTIVRFVAWAEPQFDFRRVELGHCFARFTAGVDQRHRQALVYTQ